MADVTEVATEAVAEAAEAVAEEATEIAEISRGLSGRDIRLVLTGVGVGLVGGFVAGGLYMNRRLRTEYEKIAEEEIAQMRDHFQAKERARDERQADLSELKKRAAPYVSTPDDADEPVEKDEASLYKSLAEPAEPETKNVFEDREPPVDTWDQEHEENSRQTGIPYVVSQDEYDERDDHSTTTLTYYGGDDVLCDEKDAPIEDQDRLVGVGNLDKFGHGSGDANVVYIRNEDLAVDLEVIRSHGSFAEEVAGFKHSEPERRPKRSERE